MNDQLPKIKEAILKTGGKYFQPSIKIHGKTTVIPWRHCGDFNGTVLVFDNRVKKPDQISIYKEGGKRLNFKKESGVDVVVRQINKYLAL